MIDLFAGAGGLSCGLEQAGFHPVLANELDSVASETYRLNHPDIVVINDDIRNVDTAHLFQFVKQCGKIDLIVGGPPCQGFSVNAPVRSPDDPRNHLFKDFLRVVAAFRPKAALIENVPGMLSLNRGNVLREIYRDLQDMGYSVSHRILFAGHYGVPQTRFRTVILAVHDYPWEILFPEPEYYATSAVNFRQGRELCYSLTPTDARTLKPKVTVGQAIGDLPPLSGGETHVDYDYTANPSCDYQRAMRLGSTRITSHWCPKLSRVNRERLRYIPVGGSWRDIPFEMLPAGMKRARRSDHTKRYGRLDPDELCSTIMTKCDPHWGSFFHPSQPRTLSVREAARIQSFPDRYRFAGNMTEQYKQVGNAVPPLMARALGIRLQEMLRRKERDCTTT